MQIHKKDRAQSHFFSCIRLNKPAVVTSSLVFHPVSSHKKAKTKKKKRKQKETTYALYPRTKDKPGGIHL